MIMAKVKGTNKRTRAKRNIYQPDSKEVEELNKHGKIILFSITFFLNFKLIFT